MYQRRFQVEHGTQRKRPLMQSEDAAQPSRASPSPAHRATEQKHVQIERPRLIAFAVAVSAGMMFNPL